MSPTGHEPFHRAVAALRSWLHEGRFRPGERLAAVELADELRLSATPVREAMSRLAGEGLLEERRGQGFFVGQFTRADVADLYRLHLACLLIALDPSRPQAAVELSGAVDTGPVPATERLFAAVIAAHGSRALADAFHRAQLRLGPLRRLEPEIFPDLVAEGRGLAVSAGRGGSEFAAEVRRFHLRRIREADRLNELLDQRSRS